ncbi:hypothetical protein FJT64_027859 [Amphibalanus amphitrite]|uniref:Uncharacterized protein n=1 Tax=Amphibalanus amphitrite TaxID=1232801 RepID=A0A6A4WBX1_AMPAM|nr:hypothetical protein FJT64_027859 [Amphibalanus amphitrite]
MTALRPTAPRSAPGPVYVPRALDAATHVFVRHDAVKPPLAPPYDGPYRVVARSSKTVTVERRGRHDVIAVDRVKPAHMDRRPQAPRTAAAEPPEGPSPAEEDDDTDGVQLLFSPAPSRPDSGRAGAMAEHCPDDRPPHHGRPTAPPAAPAPDAARAPRPAAGPSAPTATTRSGRAVRPPARYRDEPAADPPPGQATRARPAAPDATVSVAITAGTRAPQLNRCCPCATPRAATVPATGRRSRGRRRGGSRVCRTHRRVCFQLPRTREGAL